VVVITQNIDNLHERAGSKNVLHLHGLISKVKSSSDHSKLYDFDKPLKLGMMAEDGSQLRPHIVWFGEEVPEFDNALKITKSVNIVIIVGTSLNVYPAAGFIFHAPSNIPMYLADPGDISNQGIPNLICLKSNATIGIPVLVNQLKNVEYA
jgi:NAD-dependent deacetylase